MALRSERQGTYLYLVSSNDHIVPGGTNTDPHAHNVRRALPLVVDSVPADDGFDSLMDALHGMFG